MGFRLFRSTRPDTGNQNDLASVSDVRLAYQLILRREPDPEGLAAYSARVRAGLPLDALLQELMASRERRELVAGTRDVGAARSGVDQPIDTSASSPDRITPQSVIATHSVEELLATADRYYRSIDDPAPLLRKPFAFTHETPAMLENLGALLRGLRLGKTMTVVDFGAGTCWLSRLITELSCQVICCDASEAALDIGRRLFADHPPMLGSEAFPPVFLPFDGHRIDLPDESVDRIISFDTFHHVPNQAVVLREFSRILRPGGIVGFSEPGLHHSHDPQAQYEMRNYGVLENDIDLLAIRSLASDAGFTELTVRVMTDLTISGDDYERAFRQGSTSEVQPRVWRNAADTQANGSIFFLHKGKPRLDSRGHEGLSHRLELVGPAVVVTRDTRVPLAFRIENTGQATWLSSNIGIHGVVRLGSHLYDADDQLIDIDHSRHGLPRDVLPGDSVEMHIDVDVPDRTCRLVFDLVAEGVRWFENDGSAVVSVTIQRHGPTSDDAAEAVRPRSA